MTFITDFADQAVILPLAFAVGIALLVQGWPRGAAAWAVAIAATFTTTLVLKLVFMACSNSFGTVAINTPSGHVAAATVVVGGLAALLLRRPGIAFPLALLAAVVIGGSRLMLGVHSVPEVMVGALVGLGGATVLLVLAGSAPPGLDTKRIVLIVVAIAVLFHGLHLPAEAHIRSTALRLAKMLSVCQSDELRL